MINYLSTTVLCSSQFHLGIKKGNLLANLLNYISFNSFSVGTFIYQAEAVHILNLIGQKAYHDRHTDIMINIYYTAILLLNKHFFIRFSVRPSIDVFKLFHGGHSLL